MAVWVVRHGEDRAAAEGRFGDEGLSERGVEQAKALGKRLASEPLERALVSPLARAHETAVHALAGRDVPLELVPALAEGGIGALAGLGYADAQRRYPRDFQLGRTLVARLAASGQTAPEGETRAEFLARAERAAGLLRDALGGEDEVLVVAHGGLLNYALQILFGYPVEDRVPFGFDHCGGARLVRHFEPPDFGPFPSIRFG